ncbi:MAG TPA: Holliday junction branch migration protein RuvA [bacterium]|nr:Holliday junction branch migration protein RuvA [bacterium]HPL95433.1 Holliday junction branch migration protein RuvA [bacterium]
MISLLTGTVKHKNERSLILEVNSVGYEIFVPTIILEKTKIDEMLILFTHLHVREDALELYGFTTVEEKIFFNLLISVSGVGPKSALSVLSLAKMEEIKKAILRGDPSLLRKVSGIGQKTAERIVVELKNKLDQLPMGKEKIDLSVADAGAFEALMSLGYSPAEVREALRQIAPEIKDENEIIKQALKKMVRKNNN